MFLIIQRAWCIASQLLVDLYYCWTTEKKLANYTLGDSENEEQSERIPRIIHQTHESNSLTPVVYCATQQFRSMNQKYQYKFYNASERLKVLESYYGKDSREVRAYETVLPKTWKADLFRLCILNATGGVYMDCKGTTIVPIDTFLDKKASFATFIDVVPYRLATGGFLASSAGNSIIREMMDACVDRILNHNYGKNQLDIGGPETCGAVLNTIFLNCPAGTPFKSGTHDHPAGKIQLIGQRRLFGEYLFHAGRPVIKRQPDGYFLSWKLLQNRYEFAWIFQRGFKTPPSPYQM